MKLPDWNKRASNEEFYRDLRQFRDGIQEADEGVDFKKSARGWGYYLENEGVITKRELGKAENVINRLRKNDFGIDCSLPLDFTAQDDARTWYCDDYDGFYRNPVHFIRTKGRALVNGQSYDGRCFWDSQDVFIQVLVEKIDLVSLFKPICEEYNIPIATSKGWSSLNQRGDIITRFYRWHKKGNDPVLLYCGDHDPPGLRISNELKSNLADLENAKIPNGDGGYISGWRPDYVTIDRFGLNADFIDEHDIPWVGNLETDSSGGGVNDLSDPRHQDHDKSYVQDYLDKYGPRKVEANALVAHPDAGRQLFRETVEDYLGPNPKQVYEADLEMDRERIQQSMVQHGVNEAVDAAIDDMRGKGC